MRGAVHDVADAMAAEFEVHRVAVFRRHFADRVGDITQTVAGNGFGDARGERLLGGLDETQVTWILVFANHEADGRVTHPAVDADGEVEADQIAVLERVVIRHTVQRRIVDRNADVMGERSRAEVRRVVDVAGLRALPVGNALVHNLIDLQQIRAHLGLLTQLVENAADEMAGRLHFLDLLGCLQFDHRVLFSSKLLPNRFQTNLHALHCNGRRRAYSRRYAKPGAYGTGFRIYS